MQGVNVQASGEKGERKFETQAHIEFQESVPEGESEFQQALRSKLDRLRLWAHELGQGKRGPVDADLLEVLQVEQEVYRDVGWETVLRETEKRIEKMIKTRKLKRNWSICDLKILVWLVCKHCDREGLPLHDLQNHRGSWDFISTLIPGTSPESCLFKWLSLKRHKITLHGWSEQEEQILLQLESKHGESRNKWKLISQELYTLNPDVNKIYRHPKQCREHYASFLDPQIKKGPWTNEEDLLLLAHILQNAGEKKWCRLVKILEGRTQNAIKNRFQLIYAKLRKRKENKSKAQVELITDYILENGGSIKKIEVLALPSSPKKPTQIISQPIMEIPYAPIVPIIPQVSFAVPRRNPILPSVSPFDFRNFSLAFLASHSQTPKYP